MPIDIVPRPLGECVLGKHRVGRVARFIVLFDFSNRINTIRCEENIKEHLIFIWSFNERTFLLFSSKRFLTLFFTYFWIFLEITS